MMKPSHTMLALWLTTALASPIFGQMSSPPFTLAISTVNSTVKEKTNIYITIKQANISDSVVDCSSWDVSSTDLSFEYDVRDENDNPLKQRPRVANYPGSYKMCSLEPGKTRSGEYWISWLYDFAKPGRYSIQVSRRISSERQDYVKSNTITITVVQADSATTSQHSNRSH